MDGANGGMKLPSFAKSPLVTDQTRPFVVVYAITANVSIGRLFLAGFGPGLVIAAALMTLIWIMVRFGFISS
ncbi:MAG: TRAP transporter large permease, partial [Nitrospirota bacterium]